MLQRRGLPALNIVIPPNNQVPNPFGNLNPVHPPRTPEEQYLYNQTKKRKQEKTGRGINSFASGPTYCISQKKKTLNDDSGIDIKKMKNGSYLAMSICKECGKKKSRIISQSIYDSMKGKK